MVVVHLGAMRSGSTFLQDVFKSDPRINLILKSRYFSYDPYYHKGINAASEPASGILVDSDENYSLGRFKNQLLDHRSRTFNLKSELKVISHNLPKMVGRLSETYPDAKLLLVIREQGDWLSSVYKHDLQHYALSDGFYGFVKSELGADYITAGDYNATYELLLRHYDPSKIKYTFFEDLRSNPDQFLTEIYDFIGLEYRNDGLKDLRRNSALKDPTLYALRIANKLSETRLNHQESRLYFLLRSRLLKLSPKVDSLFPKRSVLDSKILDDVRRTFSQANLQLVGKGIDEDKLRKYGYLNGI